MGNSDSKLVFKKGILKLSEAKTIPTDDIYWTGFWKLPESAEDVFSLFTFADVRRARDGSLANIETLLNALVSRLIALRHLPAFPDQDLAPAKEALNCIRVITRILPFLYEADHLESWEDKYFWQRRKKQPRSGSYDKPEVLFDGSNSDVMEKREEEKEYETIEHTKPLGEELIDTLIDLLFYVGFTLPHEERTKDKVTYSIWQTGVGCVTPLQSSKEIENNRTEILRLLLTLSSKSLYMPAHMVPVVGVKALTYITTCPDKQIVLSLLCSQLNTTLRYNASAWRVPYDSVISKNPKQILVAYCLQLLLILILYPVPDDGRDPPPKNYFRHFLGRLHRPQDFDFLVDGMLRTLNQPLQSTSTYLPGSQKSVQWAPEMLMLFWEVLQCNKKFRSSIIDSERGNEFAVLALYYALEYKTDPAKQGVVRMCVFILQTLSTEPDFGRNLNKPFSNQEALPLSVKISEFTGTYADFIIISIHALITTSKGKLDAIYPALLATMNNIAAYIQNLNAQSSAKVIQLFASMSAPSFLLATETNYLLLQSLLESINAIIEHQYSSNRVFIRTLFKARRYFESLRSFTLESGREEIERLNRQRKESAAGADDLNSPTRMSRTGSTDTVRSPQSVRTPSLSNVPEEGGTFTIGDEDDSEDDDEREPLATPSYSSPSNQNSHTPSRSSSMDEPLPTQLRGMSEKARGKMPATQTAFSRHSSSTSLNIHAPAVLSPAVGFHPSPLWIESWLPTLPLHTILSLLASSSDASPGIPPKSLPSTIEPSPPRVHLFTWTPMALGCANRPRVGYAELASAVSNAGGLGILTALTQPTPEDLRTEIRRCRTLTRHPFAVNLTLLPALVPPDYHAYASIIISEGIRIVETAGNSPGPVIAQLKAAGIVILHKCTTIRHAESAIKLGVDFLSIDGFECAGHVGESDITNFILLARARQSVKVPFIASGGFADGQGLAAALALGAEGINMGTRFMCTVEAPIHRNVKEAIVEAKETDTELVMRRWRNTSRLFSNKVAKEAVKVERESVSGKFEDVAPYVSGKRGREVFLNGDVDFGVWTAGQVIGLIHDIPTCAELIDRIEKEAEETLVKVSSLITSSPSDTSLEPSNTLADPSGTGKAGPETPGSVGKDVNNPSAEIWGIGKPKL
ncbi:MAG: hypothetical protein Q9182_004120 [Xanthomendoza sp. 2 TL-2023]